MQAVTIVFVRLHAVGAHGLEAEFLAIHFMAYAEDFIAAGFIERSGNLEIFLESFAEAEAVK